MPLPAARSRMTCYLGTGNDIQIQGGYVGTDTVSDDWLRYDPVLGTYTARTPLPQALWGPAGSRVAQGPIHTGGRTAGGVTENDTWLFEQVAPSGWDTDPPLPLARSRMALSESTHWFYFGLGYATGDTEARGDWWRYSWVTKTYTQKTDHPAPVWGPAAGQPEADRVFVTGGRRTAGTDTTVPTTYEYTAEGPEVTAAEPYWGIAVVG